MIRAVIFDADGMVVKGVRFSDRLARDYGIPTEKTADFFKNVFPDTVLGKTDLKEVLLPYMKEWGWKGTLDELLHFWFAGEHSLDERFVEPIKKLKHNGVRCYLATNQEKYRLEYFAKDLGLAKLFDGIISSNIVGFKKPQREYFEYILKVTGCGPEEILFWDDRPVNIEQAFEFGFHAHLYENFEKFSDIISHLH
ncbi:MAG: HAD-IA family hydrolase [Patescibacteria group bacterium]